MLGAIVLAVVFVLRKELLYATFDPAGAAASGLPVAMLEYLLLGLLGVTIVVSIQAVGIIMVVAMLVTPAATAQLLVVRFGRLVGLAIAAAVAVGRRRAVPELLPERRVGRLDRARRDRRCSSLALVFSPRRGLLASRSRRSAAAPTSGGLNGTSVVRRDKTVDA